MGILFGVTGTAHFWFVVCVAFMGVVCWLGGGGVLFGGFLVLVLWFMVYNSCHHTKHAICTALSCVIPLALFMTGLSPLSLP